MRYLFLIFATFALLQARAAEHAIGPSAGEAALEMIRPAQPIEFGRARITEAWAVYADRLTFGRGQTLALLDDGCTLAKPEWQAIVAGLPKVQ